MSFRAVNPVVVEKLDPQHKHGRRFVLNGTKTNNKLNCTFRYLLSPGNFVYRLIILFVSEWSVSFLPGCP